MDFPPCILTPLIALSPHICPLLLRSPPQQIKTKFQGKIKNQAKQRSKTNTQRKTKKEEEESCHGSCILAHGGPQFTLEFRHLYLQVFIARSFCWSGSRCLVSAMLSKIGCLWSSSWISYRPVSWRSVGSSSHMIQQFIGNAHFGVNQFIALVWGLGATWIGQLPSFPDHHNLGELSSSALASILSAAYNKEQGQFCSQALRFRSPSIILPRPSLPFCLNKVQGPLSQSL